MVLVAGYLQPALGEEWTARWMEQYTSKIGGKSVKDLIIPGTHDSITYTINAKSTFAKEQDVPQQLNWLRYIGVGFIVTKIAADWSRAQGRTVTEQLQDGIRYFDMRVVYRESRKKFYTCHGLYGEELSKVLKEMNEFLNKHPREVVILDFNHLYNMKPPKTGDKHNELMTLIQGTFDKKMVPGDTYSPNVTLNELWEKKYQVIALYYNDKGNSKEVPGSKASNLLWGPDKIRSPWANKQKIEDLKKELDKYINTHTTNAPNQFFVLQGILTPDGATIAGSLKPSFKGIRSLKDFSAQLKKPMSEWLVEWRWGNKKLNIIMMDFLDDKGLVEEIIKLNLVRSSS